MRILLTNDDGIDAPGIIAMFRALRDGGEAGPGVPVSGDAPNSTAPEPADLAGPTEVFAVAPMAVQSATSHGVTFHRPLMTRETPPGGEMVGVAVDGRPADCVKLALTCIWPERYGPGSRPDLLISGMNCGANCGINIIYSGTVAAALEGAFLGIPSIAVSLMIRPGPTRFDVAARYAREAIDRVLGTGLLGAHACVNINIPVTAQDGPTPPIAVAPMNTHGLVDQYERRINPAGEVYYWSAGDGFEFREIDDDSDCHRLFNRCITVTPLGYDLTARSGLDVWRGALDKAARMGAGKGR